MITFAAFDISTSVPATTGRPLMTRSPPAPLTSIVTSSPVPLPRFTFPLSAVFPATVSVLLSVAAPVTPSVPPTDVLPDAGATVKSVPPTVRLAPVTSRPLFASTLPPNVTWLVPVCVTVFVMVTAPLSVEPPLTMKRPVPVGATVTPAFVASPSKITRFCAPLLVVNVRSLLPRFTKRLAAKGTPAFVVEPRRILPLPASL